MILYCIDKIRLLWYTIDSGRNIPTEITNQNQTEVLTMTKDFYIVYTADKEYLFGADTFVECVAYCQEHVINGANGEYIAEGTLDTKYNDFEMTEYYSLPL